VSKYRKKRRIKTTAGSDIAIEAADIALVGDDIKVISHLLLHSKRVIRTININLAASILLDFAAI
jgi:cation transport ATPase